MNTRDELQKLWQADSAEPGDPKMWRALIQEKRRGWEELVRAEDQSWYLVALCMIPLTAWAAWKAKYPWVHVGYGLMALTIALSVVGTWIASRQPQEERDRSLREYMEALLASYERRTGLIRRGSWWVMSGLTGGLAVVILGMPGSARTLQSWVIASLLVAGANVFQWISYRQWTAKISRKREEAAQMLRSLLGEERGNH